MTNPPPDPAAYFRDMLGQWEKLANNFGAEAMKSEEFVRGMAGATTATAQMQGASNEMMERALAAANLPSRADITDIAARLTAIETTLARIERHLGSAPSDATKPRPTRGRKPAVQK